MIGTSDLKALILYVAMYWMWWRAIINCIFTNYTNWQWWHMRKQRSIAPAKLATFLLHSSTFPYFWSFISRHRFCTTEPYSWTSEKYVWDIILVQQTARRSPLMPSADRPRQISRTRPHRSRCAHHKERREVASKMNLKMSLCQALYRQLYNLRKIGWNYDLGSFSSWDQRLSCMHLHRHVVDPQQHQLPLLRLMPCVYHKLLNKGINCIKAVGKSQQ